MIGREQVREREPHCAAIKAVQVPDAGIVDYAAVCARLAKQIEKRGGIICLGSRVLGCYNREGRTVLPTTSDSVEARYVVNCAGLYCDKIASLLGKKASARIVPFRGEYFKLTAEAQNLCNDLIYPVPDPAFPFLGVHFTRMIGGGLECGPNAVLAFAREGYRKSDVHLGELIDAISYSGFWRLAMKHWSAGGSSCLYFS